MGTDQLHCDKQIVPRIESPKADEEISLSGMYIHSRPYRKFERRLAFTQGGFISGVYIRICMAPRPGGWPRVSVSNS